MKQRIIKGVVLSEEQDDIIQQAADSLGVKIGPFLRMAGLAEAKRILGKA